MLRFLETTNFTADSQNLVKNFQYQPPDTKTIVPLESGLQDIFNTCISKLIYKYGLRDNIVFSLREHEDEFYLYTAYTFTVNTGVNRTQYYIFCFYQNNDIYDIEDVLFADEVILGEQFCFNNYDYMGEKNSATVQLMVYMKLAQIKHKLKGIHAKIS